MISRREFEVIAAAAGLAAAEQCANGDCGHDHTPMVDLRCPESMGKLLGRTRPVLHADGVVELACNNCARAYRRAGLPAGAVVHRYNLLGELLATEITPPAA